MLVDKEKNHVDLLRDELVNEITDCSKEALEEWSDSVSGNRAFRKLINEMKLSPEISEKGEAMKSRILEQVNKRISRIILFTRALKIGSVAASVIVLLSITGYLSYQLGFRKVNSQQVELLNPLGMLSTVMLPDGSKVILNAGTTLVYPNAFVSDTREVSVNGEAYFEVVCDTERPFIVKTDNVSVNVLGTQFNVKNYGNDERIEISLSGGKIGVQVENQKEQVFLAPGEQAYYDKQTGMIITRAVNIVHYVSWKDGVYYFRALPLKELVKQLERIFNVRIQIASPQLEDIIITGDFLRGENLEQILRVITADKRLKYRIEEKIIYIEAR